MSGVARDGSPVELYARLPSWPDHPPYGGAFDEVIHHLTVADGAPPGVLDRLEPELADLLPISQPVRDLVLAVRRRGTWTVRARYSLGTVAR